MAPQRGYRRTHYVVDRRFQFKYTAFIVGIGAVIAVICAMFILKAWQENTELLAISQAIANEINRRESTKVFWMVGVFVLLEVVGLFFWGVVVTHRIAGPLFIIDRYLGALRSGIYPDMRPLRRSDELRQFFESFSSTVDLLRERESQDIEVIAAALGTMPEGEAKDKLRELQERKKSAVAGDKSKEPAPAAAN
jgi:hypothetical protein